MTLKIPSFENTTKKLKNKNIYFWTWSKDPFSHKVYNTSAGIPSCEASNLTNGRTIFWLCQGHTHTDHVCRTLYHYTDPSPWWLFTAVAKGFALHTTCLKHVIIKHPGLCEPEYSAVKQNKKKNSDTQRQLAATPGICMSILEVISQVQQSAKPQWANTAAVGTSTTYTPLSTQSESTDSPTEYKLKSLLCLYDHHLKSDRFLQLKKVMKMFFFPQDIHNCLVRNKATKYTASIPMLWKCTSPLNYTHNTWTSSNIVNLKMNCQG